MDTAMTDRVTITITGLEVFGRHGVHEEERRLGQRFLIGVRLTLSRCPAVDDDDLAGTVDYAALAASIGALVAGTPSRLLEHLAGRVADLALRSPFADSVTVTIDKPHVALAQPVVATGVSLRRKRRHTYWIGLGSNLGDRLAELQQMIDAMAAHGVAIEAISPVYETAPQLLRDQPAFLNAVVRIRTTRPPRRLLATLKRLERQQGRDAAAERFGPRPIDADILLWDGGWWRDERLVVPHPRLTERRFAMEPLLALDGDAALPDGTAIATHHERIDPFEQRVTRCDDGLRPPAATSDTAPSA